MPRTATPDDFFTAALRLLAGPGLPALRIGRLCAEVGVTSGSFYHHFGSWDGFVAALLEHWTREEVDRIVELVRGEADAAGRLALMKSLALTVPHDAERALRRWAGTDAVVDAAQRRVDERRREAIVEVLLPVVDDAALAATLAEVGLSLLVGHQQLRGGSGPGLDAVLDQFERLVLVSGAAGSAATAPR